MSAGIAVQFEGQTMSGIEGTNFEHDNKLIKYKHRAVAGVRLEPSQPSQGNLRIRPNIHFLPAGFGRDNWLLSAQPQGPHIGAVL